MRIAKDATNFLYLLLKSAIAADVPLMPPQNQTVSQFSSIEELRHQCCELTKKLYQAELAKQILVALELVGQIARLVHLESEVPNRVSKLVRFNLIWVSEISKPFLPLNYQKILYDLCSRNAHSYYPANDIYLALYSWGDYLASISSCCFKASCFIAKH